MENGHGCLRNFMMLKFGKYNENSSIEYKLVAWRLRIYYLYTIVFGANTVILYK